jgi:hypothetical protein
MQYPSFEARLSREQATRTLARICEHLDRNAEATVASAARKYDKKAPPLVMRAVRLWVVGSYARGSMTCGDLDLVMELDREYYDPRPISRQLLKSPQRVSLYTGTPEENSSHAQFADAALIWEAGSDWRAALAAIKPDATASRFDRPTDRIPFRLDQMSGCSIEWAETMIERLQCEELSWHFVPLEDLTDAVEHQNESDEQTALLRRATNCSSVGSASKKLLPYLLAYARFTGKPQEKWRVEYQTRLDYGRTVFFLGVAPSLHDLDETGINEVVVMPHMSMRGPNGLWVIKRGLQHPLVRAFGGCEGWAISDAQDNLVVGQWSQYVDRWRSHTKTAYIFQSEQAAHEYIEDYYDVFQLKPNEARVRHLKGADFLEVLDSCEMLDGDLWTTVFSERGKHQAQCSGYGDDDLTVCSIEELAAQFRPSASPLSL